MKTKDSHWDQCIAPRSFPICYPTGSTGQQINKEFPNEATEHRQELHIVQVSGGDRFEGKHGKTNATSQKCQALFLRHPLTSLGNNSWKACFYDMLPANDLLLSLCWAVLSFIFLFILQCFCNWGTDETRENQPIEHSPVAKWALKFPQEAMSLPKATCYTLSSLTFSVWILVLRTLKRPRAGSSNRQKNSFKHGSIWLQQCWIQLECNYTWM